MALLTRTALQFAARVVTGCTFSRKENPDLFAVLTSLHLHDALIAIGPPIRTTDRSKLQSAETVTSTDWLSIVV